MVMYAGKIVEGAGDRRAVRVDAPSVRRGALPLDPAPRPRPPPALYSIPGVPPDLSQGLVAAGSRRAAAMRPTQCRVEEPLARARCRRSDARVRVLPPGQRLGARGERARDPGRTRPPPKATLATRRRARGAARARPSREGVPGDGRRRDPAEPRNRQGGLRRLVQRAPRRDVRARRRVGLREDDDRLADHRAAPARRPERFASKATT